MAFGSRVCAVTLDEAPARSCSFVPASHLARFSPHRWLVYALPSGRERGSKHFAKKHWLNGRQHTLLSRAGIHWEETAIAQDRHWVQHESRYRGGIGESSFCFLLCFRGHSFFFFTVLRSSVHASWCQWGTRAVFWTTPSSASVQSFL